MRGLTLLFIALFGVSPFARAEGGSTGFNTGGSGMSQGEHDSSDPGETKLLLNQEQRGQIKMGRDNRHVPAGVKKKLDEILRTPNASAFEREQVLGQVSYQQNAAGWDGRNKSNPRGKSSLDRSLEGPAPRGETLRERHQDSLKPKNLNTPMSALEAGSRRMMAQPRPGSPEAPARFNSLRDGAPMLVPTDRAVSYRDSERRARRRLRNEESNAAYSELARSQIGQGQFDEARAAADKALNANPRDADAYALRAIASEGLGDEASKMAALQEAARLNPKRFKSLLQNAQRGAKLFDPSANDSWHLLDALAGDAPDGRGISGRTIAWTVLILLIVGIPLTAGMSFYRRLTPEQQRRAASWWRTASRGQILPHIKTESASPVRRPDGSSIVQLEPGLRVADKYKLVRRIGIDGTVEIWKAMDSILDRPILLKRLYESRAESGEWERRLADAKKAATLHHPNVVDLYEILDMPIGLFVVYEYPSGKTLRDVILEVGPIPLLQAIDILIPVCRALQHAHHRGIVHGGLSPERIVLTRQGYIKVTDFVLARTTAGGGEDYVAPEARRGDPTRASDIYSLGVCLFELLTGAAPGRNGDVDPDARAEELLESALDLDGSTRTQSARVFQKQLETLRAGLKPESGRPLQSSSDQDDGTRNETTA